MFFVVLPIDVIVPGVVRTPPLFKANAIFIPSLFPR